MSKIKIKKAIFIILICSYILSFIFLSIHIKHECSHDDNCCICMIINNINKNLNNYFSKSMLIIIPVFFIGLREIYYKFERNNIKKLIIINLKVELIN